jgi:3-methyl-2-oxobutanoate hydroxymethyltransferase
VPDRIAADITERLRIPTIGIGAGAGTSGQVLVIHDLLGITARAPRFVKRYGAVGAAMADALRAFREDVSSGAFPAPEHAYPIDDDEYAAFRMLVDEGAPAPPVR